MELPAFVGLAAAAAAAGAVNAIAGGGTLITFPSLLAAGFSTKVANVTSTVAIWPGTVGGSFAYRRELRARRRRVVILSGPSVLGALVGSVLLLATSQRLFDAIVPWLIIFAAVLLAMNARLAAFAYAHRIGANHEEHTPASLLIAVFLVGVYGGYFGAGIGILMLAFMAILAPDGIQHANAVKGMLAMLMNFVALVVFSLFGPVQWLPAGVMAVGAILGGYSGVALARRLNATVLRFAIVAWGISQGLFLLAR
ncbi:MAG: sulfite exporter TauE/SafE family protein [Dehalococcoidia bacterium]|nr:sulfite exporter TauE/SafE family protein [Dehalococcoidia bacterium]